MTGKNFTATPTARYLVSGTVTVGGAGLSMVTVCTDTGVSTTTATNGSYMLSNLPTNKDGARSMMLATW